MISPTFTVNAAGFFVRRTAAKLGNAPAIWIRDHSISARFGSIPRTISGFILLGFALLVSDDGGKTFREDLIGQIASGYARARHSKWKCAAAETAKRGTRGQAPKPPKPPISLRLIIGNDGGVYPKLRWRQRLGAFESDPCGRILSHLIRRLEADLPDRRWLAG